MAEEGGEGGPLCAELGARSCRGSVPITLAAMTPGLCLMTVHAHPDDESSKGAGTVALYHRQGIRTVLVCCTGGEAGDVLNPAMDRPDVRGRLPEIRREELAEAARIIGYDEIVYLGYRDSGMPGSSANDRPDCFARAPLDEAVGRLVAAMRRERPHVVVAYPEDQSGYPHPDHIRAHEVAVAAFDACGDPAAFPDAGPPWQPAKLYYTRFSARRVRALHEEFAARRMESPFTDEWLARFPLADPATAVVDISAVAGVPFDALLAHATQVDPQSPFWFGLPRDVLERLHPYDEYVLARPAVAPEDVPDDVACDDVESDLFAGLRSPSNMPDA